MERFYICIVMVFAGAEGSQVIEDLIRANNQSAADLPSWYPSTRCSAGVTHTTPPGFVSPPMSDNDVTNDETKEKPDNSNDDNVETIEPVITTASTIGEYLAPGKHTKPAHYFDDE